MMKSVALVWADMGQTLLLLVCGQRSACSDGAVMRYGGMTASVMRAGEPQRAWVAA